MEKKTVKVLVFPAGTEIGLEINRSLFGSTFFKIYGAGSVADHATMVYRNCDTDVPFVDDDGCIAKINEIIDREKIDFVIPAHDSAVLKFAEHRAEIHCRVLTSDAETCRICRSKRETYRVLGNIIRVPAVYDSPAASDFPLFAKPDVGQGARGAMLLRTIEDYQKIAQAARGKLIVSEYLPGKEYTVDCFTDRTGRLLFSAGRERARISNGISVRSYPADRPEFMEIAEKINSAVKFRGMWFFQLKEASSGELTLLEMAPRIAGTMGLYRALGVNFVQLSLFDAMDMPVKVLRNGNSLVVDRALFSCFKQDISYRTVYIDFDDTIVLDGMVVPQVMAFLYQAKNCGRKIVLLTRHAATIREDLTEKCIPLNLFDRIIRLESRADDKSSYIDDAESILIDDSFAERSEVSSRLHIPVFSLDQIDSLMDYRI